MDKLEILDVTRSELEDMEGFCTDYKKIENFLFGMLNVIQDKEFEETVRHMIEDLYDYEKSKYEEYMEKLDEYENYNENDYNTNEGIWEDLMEDRRKGFND